MPVTLAAAQLALTIQNLRRVFRRRTDRSSQPVRLTGEISSRKERRAALSRFASAQARVLVETDVAGKGLNLQDHCHHLDQQSAPSSSDSLHLRSRQLRSKLNGSDIRGCTRIPRKWHGL
jgi:superfamily II DNA/RNA helicase